MLSAYMNVANHKPVFSVRYDTINEGWWAMTQAQVTKDEQTQNNLQVNIVGCQVPEQEKVFTEGAVNLLSALCKNFMVEVETLLSNRAQRQKLVLHEIDNNPHGSLYQFH